MNEIISNKENCCCFFGHRKINETEVLRNKIYNTVEKLIIEQKVHTFLFGSKSDFNSLCLDIASKIKEKYPHIKRVYVRSAYADADEYYTNYLLKFYEDTYFPEKIRGSGKASYVERNQEMINKSKYCVVYYDENYLPPRRKKSRRDLTDYQPESGTKLAYDYAVKMKSQIINVFG